MVKWQCYCSQKSMSIYCRSSFFGLNIQTQTMLLEKSGASVMYLHERLYFGVIFSIQKPTGQLFTKFFSFLQRYSTKNSENCSLQKFWCTKRLVL